MRMRIVAVVAAAVAGIAALVGVAGGTASAAGDNPVVHTAQQMGRIM